MAASSSWLQARLPWKELRGIRLEPTILNHGPIDRIGNNISSAHPFYTWWYLEKGSVILTLKNGSHTVPARHWTLIPAGIYRHQAFSRDAVINSINFAALWPNGLPILRLPGLLIESAAASNPLIRAALAVHQAAGTPFSSRFISLEEREFSLGRRVRLISATATFISSLFSQRALRDAAHVAPATGDARLDLVFDHLLRHLRAGPLPYSDWKRVTGLSRAHLDRLAHAHLGYSLRQHRDRLLLAEIHRRLSVDHSSIKLHALELGFIDSSHFCHWVKRQSRLTPQALAAWRA